MKVQLRLHLPMLMTILFAVAGCKSDNVGNGDIPVPQDTAKDSVVTVNSNDSEGQIMASYFAMPSDLAGCYCTYTANFKGGPNEILFAYTYGDTEVMRNMAYLQVDGEFRKIPMTGSRPYKGQMIHTFEGQGYKVKAAVVNKAKPGKDQEQFSSEATIMIESISGRAPWRAQVKGQCGC